MLRKKSAAVTLYLKHIQVRDFILEFQRVHKRHPSHKVIMADCGIKSSRETWEIINELKAAGELSGPVYEAPKAKAASASE
jgi:hypothetical protein